MFSPHPSQTIPDGGAISKQNQAKEVKKDFSRNTVESRKKAVA